jgi:hypothetical protein
VRLPVGGSPHGSFSYDPRASFSVDAAWGPAQEAVLMISCLCWQGLGLSSGPSGEGRGPFPTTATTYGESTDSLTRPPHPPCVAQAVGRLTLDAVFDAGVGPLFPQAGPGFHVRLLVP